MIPLTQNATCALSLALILAINWSHKASMMIRLQRSRVHLDRRKACTLAE